MHIMGFYLFNIIIMSNLKSKEDPTICPCSGVAECTVPLEKRGMVDGALMNSQVDVPFCVARETVREIWDILGKRRDRDIRDSHSYGCKN